MSNSPFFQTAQLWLQGGSGVGVATLTGNRTLDGRSAHFQNLTASGGDRNVNLPALGSRGAGQWFGIRNAGASNNLLVKDSGGTTQITLAPGDWAILVSGSVSGSLAWYVQASSAGLTSLTLSGALAAVAATFTGIVTTTDGVASGDARRVGGRAHEKSTSTPVTNTTTETTIGSHTLPANTIKEQTKVMVRGALRVTGNAGGHTVTLRLKLGSTTYMSVATLAMVANDIAVFEAMITGRAAPGAASEVAVNANMTVTASGTPTTSAVVPAPANYATNGALAVSVTAQWSAASASDILIGEQFSVEVVG